MPTSSILVLTVLLRLLMEVAPATPPNTPTPLAEITGFTTAVLVAAIVTSPLAVMVSSSASLPLTVTSVIELSFKTPTARPAPTPSPAPPRLTLPALTIPVWFALMLTVLALTLLLLSMALVELLSSVTVTTPATPPIPATPAPTPKLEIPCAESASTSKPCALMSLLSTLAVTLRLIVLVSLARPTPAPMPPTAALPTKPDMLL